MDVAHFSLHPTILPEGAQLTAVQDFVLYFICTTIQCDSDHTAVFRSGHTGGECPRAAAARVCAHGRRPVGVDVGVIGPSEEFKTGCVPVSFPDFMAHRQTRQEGRLPAAASPWFRCAI